MPGKSKQHGCHKIGDRRPKSKLRYRRNKENARTPREQRLKALAEAKAKFLPKKAAAQPKAPAKIAPKKSAPIKEEAKPSA